MRWTALLALLLTFIPVAAIANPTRTLLKLGAEGADVTEVQALLKLLGYYEDVVDGRYAESTLIAVTRFQEAAGLSQDGILGLQTWAKLLPAAEALPPAETKPADTKPAKSMPQPASPAAVANPKPAPAAEPASSKYPILRKGAKGDAVVRLQTRLRSIGLLQTPADGDFGAATELALKAAQQKYNLESDGVVGEATWRALKL
ncbi:MAG: peptidoglycan-binding protein [Alkalinema sp. FL-bin-369]|nr:peptidoglycan-binding protein [Leptolyngbyaceae cyanobacterium LF-bin-369]